MLPFGKISALILVLLRSFPTCSKQIFFFANLVEVIDVPNIFDRGINCICAFHEIAFKIYIKYNLGSQSLET